MLQLSSTEAQIALHAEEDSDHEAKHLILLGGGRGFAEVSQSGRLASNFV